MPIPRIKMKLPLDRNHKTTLLRWIQQHDDRASLVENRPGLRMVDWEHVEPRYIFRERVDEPEPAYRVYDALPLAALATYRTRIFEIDKRHYKIRKNGKTRFMFCAVEL